MLEQACGRDVAGRMHTARSRNDIAITLYRMVARRELLSYAGELAHLRGVVLGLAAKHLETIMPSWPHTHTQPASTDHSGALPSRRVRVSGPRCRPGSSGFRKSKPEPPGRGCPHDLRISYRPERYTAKLLRFEGLAENPLRRDRSHRLHHGNSGCDHAVAMVNLGKLTQDLLLWSSREFGFSWKLSGGFVQSSSIMPQKRNPGVAPGTHPHPIKPRPG